jgi:hypothetical protein
MPKLSRACGARLADGLADGLAEAQAALAAQGGQLAELKASLASLQAVVAPLQASHAAQSAQIAELVAAEQEAAEEVRRLRARLNVEVAGRAELLLCWLSMAVELSSCRGSCSCFACLLVSLVSFTPAAPAASSVKKRPSTARPQAFVFEIAGCHFTPP